MRTPKLRIRTIMIFVAIAGCGFATRVSLRHSRQYAKMAAAHEAKERTIQAEAAIYTQLLRQAYDPSTPVAWPELEFASESPSGSAAGQTIDAIDEIEFRRLREAEREFVIRMFGETIRSYERAAASEHVTARAYRRAARFPLLGAPRVPSNPLEVW
jgi:hypothetical protein